MSETVLAQATTEASSAPENITIKTSLPNASALSPLLQSEYFREFAAGTLAAAAISAPMAIIDNAIIRAQFQKMSLGKATTTLTKELFTGVTPWNPPLGIMFKVYGATYLTANLTEIACLDLGIDPSVPTSALTSIVNCAMIAWKDKEYAKLYQRKSTGQFPKISYALFTLRDGLTIVSSFQVKHKASQYLQSEYQVNQTTADIATSFAVPMFAQLFSSPLHIVAMDIYENPTANYAARWQAIKKGYMSVCTGRILRIIPAFGMGGYINDKISENLSPVDE